MGDRLYGGYMGYVSFTQYLTPQPLSAPSLYLERGSSGKLIRPYYYRKNRIPQINFITTEKNKILQINFITTEKNKILQINFITTEKNKILQKVLQQKRSTLQIHETQSL